MKPLYLFLFVLLLSACTENIVFNSENRILGVDKLDDQKNFIILTSKHLFKTNPDSQEIIWKVESDYQGDIKLIINESIYILDTKKGIDGITKIDQSDGHTLFKHYSDEISMYRLIIIKSKGKEYFWAEGEIIKTDTTIHTNNEINSFITKNKKELEWLSKDLRANSRIGDFELLKQIMDITKEIPNKKGIAYVQFNNKYLILEYDNYFNYYSIPEGKKIGKISTDGFGLRTLRSNYVIEPLNRVINLETQEIEKTKKHQLDLIFLGDQRFNVYQKEIRKVN
jgi:hypothetical protein